MDNIIWDNDKPSQGKLIPIHIDFERNKLKAESSAKKHTERNLDNFRIAARSHHLEIGITYPRSHSKTNNYHTVPYNMDAGEFDRRCKNEYDYFHKIYLSF